MAIQIVDIEVYRNFFLASFMDSETGEVTCFERSPWSEFDGPSLLSFMEQHTTVGFNSIKYDVPVIMAASIGYTNEQLKQLSDLIIQDGMQPWEVERYLGITFSPVDHIDLVEPAPGVMVSLKIYGGRLHSQRLQDLPISPDDEIFDYQADVLRTYCVNDLITTRDLYHSITPQLKLRETMSEEYGIDLRSKSDAQIAEAVIKGELTKLTGEPVYRPTYPANYTFQYDPPGWMAFQTESMREVFETVKATEFSLSDKGSVVMPKELQSMKVKIGNGIYRMGIGGLHSSEKKTSHVSDDNYILLDRDVTSYYPSIILGERLYSQHLGPKFLEIYETIVQRRLEAKAIGNKVVADSLKICINGSFGKLGSKWSALYAPKLLIQVTVTGQLALLMLIEAIELAGIEVASANTDGIVIKCRRDRIDELNLIVHRWEMLYTGYVTEETRYKALYSRDVNNYVAIKEDGGVKTKGVYAKAGLMKNPTSEICIDAVIAKLTGQSEISQTIRECKDIRKFLTIRTVKGGAVWRGRYLGKAVRWYYSTDGNQISYKSNGNKVAKSDSCRPMMELTEGLPHDLDYDWYIREAHEMLKEIGY